MSLSLDLDLDDLDLNIEGQSEEVETTPEPEVVIDPPEPEASGSFEGKELYVFSKGDRVHALSALGQGPGTGTVISSRIARSGKYYNVKVQWEVPDGEDPAPIETMKSTDLVLVINTPQAMANLPALEPEIEAQVQETEAPREVEIPIEEEDADPQADVERDPADDLDLGDLDMPSEEEASIDVVPVSLSDADEDEHMDFGELEQEEEEETPIRHDGLTPAVQECLGLVDHMDMAKLIGLPIDFQIDNFVDVVNNLRLIIGLPAGSDIVLMAEKIQRDHFHINRAQVALEWAAKEAKTAFEAWEASQRSELYRAARHEYETVLMPQYKAKKIERPLAPNRDDIKDDLKADPLYIKYKKAVHKIEYWRDIMSKVAVSGHDRKAMLLMSISKSQPQESVTARRDDPHQPLDPEMSGSSDIELDDDEDGVQDPPPLKLVKDEEPLPYGGRGDLFPWLLKDRPAESKCEKCQSLVYIMGSTAYNVDRTVHDQTCKGGPPTLPSTTSSSTDIDLDLDFDDPPALPAPQSTSTVAPQDPVPQTVNNQKPETPGFADDLELDF